MKGKRVVFVLVAIIMVLAFVMTSCGSMVKGAQKGVEKGVSDGVSGAISGAFGRRSGPSVGGGSSSSSSSSSRSSGSRGVRTVPWPNDATWTRYGLAGLQQPANTQVTGAAMFMGYYAVTLLGGGEAAFNSIISQIENIPETMQMTEMTKDDGILKGYLLPTGNMVQVIWAWGEEKDGSEDEIGIHAYPIR